MKKILSVIFFGLFAVGHSQGLITGLQACYPLNCDGAVNGATTGSQWNGTILGNVTCATGNLGLTNTAYQFGGTSSDKICLYAFGFISGSQGFSISGWFYVSSNSNQYLIYKNSGCGTLEAWSLQLQAGGTQPSFVMSRVANPCSSPTALSLSSGAVSLNAWHHVVFYMSPTVMTLWVDNSQFTSSNPNLAINWGANGPIVLGGTDQTFNSPFSGKMDNVRFYNRLLLASEITDLFTGDPSCNSVNGTPAPPPPTPGNYCNGSANGLTGDYQVPLNTFNYNFTNSTNSSSKVLIGRTTCGGGSARLDVLDNNIGNGIYSYCATSGNNIGIKGTGGNGTSNTASNIFGVIGEANMASSNQFGNSAGVAGFCGQMSTNFMPPGQNIGVYGNSIANGGRWAGYFDGDVQFNGTVWGSQYMWGSDKRLKTNIKELGSVTEQIKKLKSYTYLYNTEEFKNKNFPKTEQIGFMAQELKEVFPQLVAEDNKGYLGVNYVGFIPVLLEAVKEQQQQIDELKALVQSLAGTPNNSASASTGLTVILGDKNSIVLNQNVPNPFAETTVITYNIPTDFAKAEIIFTTNEGVVIKTVVITQKGQGSLNVFANDLSHGVYTYTLVVDGKSMASKKLVKE